MRRMLSSVLFAMAVLSAAPVFAQGTATAVPVGATPVAITAAPTCTVFHKDAAVNTTATVTITPTASLPYVYIYAIDLSVSNDGTGAVTQANVQFTSTNMNGWVYTYSSANAANTTAVDRSFVFQTPAKSVTPGTAVTFVSPAINAHAAYSINVCAALGAQ